MKRFYKHYQLFFQVLRIDPERSCPCFCVCVCCCQQISPPQSPALINLPEFISNCERVCVDDRESSLSLILCDIYSHNLINSPISARFLFLFISHTHTYTYVHTHIQCTHIRKCFSLNLRFVCAGEVFEIPLLRL